MNKKCEGCYHCRDLYCYGTKNRPNSTFEERRGYYACHYALDTGELREVPSSECTHYITKKEWYTKVAGDLRKQGKDVKTCLRQMMGKESFAALDLPEDLFTPCDTEQVLHDVMNEMHE